MEAFYETVTSFCFTLLGLWWAVVQFRYTEWMSDSNYRRLAYSIHLSFLIPGAMSLGALLGNESRIIWRAVFIVASLLGLIATFFITSTIKRDAIHSWLLRDGYWFMMALYVLITLIAMNPGLVRALSPGINPLQVEGFFVSLLIILSVSLAWELMAIPRQQDQQRSPAQD